MSAGRMNMQPRSVRNMNAAVPRVVGWHLSRRTRAHTCLDRPQCPGSIGPSQRIMQPFVRLCRERLT